MTKRVKPTKASPLAVCEIVKTLEFSDITVNDELTEPLRFRLEILKIGSRRYRGRVLRLETFIVRPRFVSKGGLKSFEAQFWIVDEVLIDPTREASSARGVLQHFRHELKARMG